MTYDDILTALIAELGEPTERDSDTAAWLVGRFPAPYNAITAIACRGSVCVTAERGVEPANYAHWHVEGAGNKCGDEVVEVTPLADVIAGAKRVLEGKS